MIKEIPDDVILVIAGVFSAVIFAWSHNSWVYTQLDFFIYIFVIGCMIIIPMLYSSYFYYKNK